MGKIKLTPAMGNNLFKVVAHIKEQTTKHSFDELIEVFHPHNIDQMSATERVMDFNYDNFCFSIHELHGTRLAISKYVEVFDRANGLYLGYTIISNKMP